MNQINVYKKIVKAYEEVEPKIRVPASNCLRNLGQRNVDNFQLKLL